jgi:hypothetical protein
MISRSWWWISLDEYGFETVQSILVDRQSNVTP